MKFLKMKFLVARCGASLCEEQGVAEHRQPERSDNVLERVRHEVFGVVVEEGMDHGKQFEHLVRLAAAVARLLQPTVEVPLE